LVYLNEIWPVGLFWQCRAHGQPMRGKGVHRYGRSDQRRGADQPIWLFLWRRAPIRLRPV